MTVLALVLSWLGLAWVGEMMAWSLAPYDTTPLDRRPPQGTWQRDVSDFFQYSVGSKMLAVILVGLSLALFLLALRKMPNSSGGRARLLMGFALSNFALAASVSVSGFLMAGLSVELTPYPGYGWTVKFLVPEVVLVGLWIMLLARTIPRRIRLQS